MLAQTYSLLQAAGSLAPSAHTPASTHLRTNNLQAAQGEHLAGTHLPTVTPSKKR